MNKIKTSEFIIDRIKNKEFKDVIPELYELEGVIENNLWHTNDSVFDHIISVVTELEDVIERANENIKNYLGEKIDNYTKKEILFLGSIFHDIAKKETFIKEGDATKCTGHEEKGGEKVKDIIKRFDLSEREQGLVIQTVKNHGVIHEILNNPDEDIEKQVDDFKEEHPDIFLETALLAMADLLGSQLKNNSPKEFEFRKEFLNNIISNY